jgi:hypothetical protein
VAFIMGFSASDGWAAIEGQSWNVGPAWRDWKNAKAGRNLHFRVGMMTPGMGVTLARIAAGEHDSHYVKLANRLASYGFLDAELALGWEMDGGWYPWSAKAGNGQQANFQAAWRRIVTVMRNAQPTNRWIWVWNPDGLTWPNAAYLETIWPGNSYVDRVGMDVYDLSWYNIDGVSTYYPSTCDASCRLSRQQKVWDRRVVRLNTIRDFAASKGKPLSFPEWGCTTHRKDPGHGGDDNPYFIQKMHEFIVNPANNVVMQAYFDDVNSLFEHRIGPPTPVFPLAAAKFKQLFGAGSQ